jgi:hypothetical protein
MKRILLLLMLASFASSLLAEVVIISGIYQGKDLYVRNPMTADSAGYCVFEVLVNGNVTADQVNSASFAVDLATWKLAQGDALEIVLRCKENCDVKILNPEVIYPNSTYTVSSMNIDPAGGMTWTTENESATLTFVIEQFKWNKWIKIGELKGQGKPKTCTYSFPAKLHSGLNTFRIYQMDYKGQHSSEEFKVESTSPDVKIKNLKISDRIEFSAETDFEVVSEFGALVSSGRGQYIDASKYSKGKYYVNFDNKVGSIVEKK